ncbi:MAG: T9SS type A sorting domain-containing protein [Ignavibacteria bacterium]|nr:T9SS type A sorting domain-containing protein [Ignavibacteria bacterium]
MDFCLYDENQRRNFNQCGGYDVDFSACWASTYAGTSGAQGNFCVAQLNSSPVPVGISPSTGIPAEFSLLQNFPNPFNPVTQIKYNIPSDSRVTLNVLDMLGREVASLVSNSMQKAGFYTVEFNAGNLTSGTYFYKLTARNGEKDIVITKKMLLIK